MAESEYPYNSLREINLRKSKLRGEIRTQEKNINRLWNGIFHQKEKKGVATPSQRVSQIISTGAGVFDGVMLGWKLYRRFKK